MEYGSAKSRHDPRTALERCSEDFVLEVVPFGETIKDKEQVIGYLEGFFRSFPDYTGEVESTAFGADVMIVLWQLRGTLRGEFLGQPPTGRPAAVPAVSAFFFCAGKLSGERVYFDLATFCRQAGLPLPRAALSVDEPQVVDAAAARS